MNPYTVDYIQAYDLFGLKRSYLNKLVELGHVDCVNPIISGKRGKRLYVYSSIVSFLDSNRK